jgi:DNA-binding HxlR family transcriptional regulator
MVADEGPTAAGELPEGADLETIDLEAVDRRAASEAVAPLFALLGRAHTLDVLYELASAGEPLRFSELQARLELPSATLSTRLTELVEAGFVDRESHGGIPPRVEYEATERTRELKPAYRHLLAWSVRHGEPVD